MDTIDIKEYEDMMMFDLRDDERASLNRRLNELTESFAAIEKANTDGVEPLVTVLELRNILRDDVADKLITRDELLSNAPEHRDGFFRVPGTL